MSRLRKAWLRFLPALALALCGCAGSFEEARAPRVSLTAGAPQAAVQTAQDCNALDHQEHLLAASSAFWGVVGGASGVTSIPVKSDGARIGFATTAIVSAGLALATGMLSQADATDWAKECSGP